MFDSNNMSLQARELQPPVRNLSSKFTEERPTKFKSEALFSQIQNSLMSMKDELERECDDLTDKIDEIMRSEVLTFDKLRDIEFSSGY